MYLHVSDTCTDEVVIVMNRNFVYMYQRVSATCTDEVSYIEQEFVLHVSACL